MFSTAIVIFREALEIAVILGVVLAATRGLANRTLWIVAGFTGGILGASLVAVFARSISDALSGIGQEIFNACILFTAALFIGWTVIWMRKHSREMTAQLRQVGKDVAAGKMPFYSLSIIIGLALLREGSEIVLFIYGMILSGQTIESIIEGSLVGCTLGIIAGVMLYYGLIKISAKYMFQVTSWLLILLVAGLASQGASFLLAAGYLSGLSKQVWDTSWLLSEGSISGKALHSLIGYSAKPALAQIIFYIATLAILLGTIAITEKKAKKVLIAAIIISPFLVSLISKPAYAIDEIYYPQITKGEWELEYKGASTLDHRRDKNTIEGHAFELEYSPTDYWKTAINGAFVKEPGGDFRGDVLEFENQFQFTNPGEYWMDSGVRIAYGFAQDKGVADDLEVKMLFSKDIDRFTTVADLGFTQELGSNAHDGIHYSLIGASFYRYMLLIQPGIEFQSDLGTPGQWQLRNNDYYIGPALYGEIPGTSANHWKYEFAYLFGLTNSAADNALRVKLEYEFRF